MPLEGEERSSLQTLVTEARTLLQEEFSTQLASLYGIQSDHETTLSALSHLSDEELAIATSLRERIAHIAGSQAAARSEAVQRLIREQAFTVLNRFAALRMAEERKLVRECLRRGYDSEGFKVYLQTTAAAMGERYERYRAYLFSLFDELALDLGLLFDRFSPDGMLFPRQPALEALLAVVNRSDCAALWVEDETIGWIYQYFNPADQRREMRKAGAPRTSRELAVRNQFFTPRYVVAFLVDNTLGRLWVEMTGGVTKLVEGCEYLVRDDGSGGVTHPLKDPREIRVLDPACGSMHFGLYAFDLLETIYEETWDRYPQLLGDLRAAHRSKESFLAAVPQLIIEHNLHGIEIDRRAVQIAALSLWLRAQRSFAMLGLKPGERPAIRRTHIVCAEPMPSERDYLDEIARSQSPGFVADLVRELWEQMKLADVAGSLLKVEETLEGSLARVRASWESLRREVTTTKGQYLFDEQKRRDLTLLFGYDADEIDSGSDWGRVESGVIEALRELTVRAGGEDRYKRGLFAHDAAGGLGFIDILRRRYDVVLMNPPFGDSAVRAKEYIVDHYPRTKNDLYAAFVERFLARLEPGGYLGAITSRTGFFLSSFRAWREEVLLTEARPVVFADLGFGVLDNAMVETAAYVLQPAGRPVPR